MDDNFGEWVESMGVVRMVRVKKNLTYRCVETASQNTALHRPFTVA